jgi:hypothetical protein
MKVKRIVANIGTTDPFGKLLILQHQPPPTR